MDVVEMARLTQPSAPRLAFSRAQAEGIGLYRGIAALFPAWCSSANLAALCSAIEIGRRLGRLFPVYDAAMNRKVRSVALDMARLGERLQQSAPPPLDFFGMARRRIAVDVDIDYGAVAEALIKAVRLGEA